MLVPTQRREGAVGAVGSGTAAFGDGACSKHPSNDMPSLSAPASAGPSQFPQSHVNLRRASCVHFPSTSCFLATSLFSKLRPFNGLKRRVLNVFLCHAA